MLQEHSQKDESSAMCHNDAASEVESSIQGDLPYLDFINSEGDIINATCEIAASIERPLNLDRIKSGGETSKVSLTENILFSVSHTFA